MFEPGSIASLNQQEAPISLQGLLLLQHLQQSLPVAVQLVSALGADGQLPSESKLLGARGQLAAIWAVGHRPPLG